MEVLIRPFRPDDLDGLFVLDYRCYAPPYRFGYQQLLLTLQQAEITALVIEGERKGDIIGGLLVRGERAAQRVAVVSLMIDPDYRRNGLGTRLLDWSVGFARKSGWEAVVVPVERANGDAVSFLVAQGFTDTGTAQPYYKAPEEGTLWRKNVEDSVEADGTQPAGEAEGEAP